MNIRRVSLIQALASAAALATPEAAPQAPATEAFLAPWSGEGRALTVGAWTNISSSPGYDNQPSIEQSCHSRIKDRIDRLDLPASEVLH